MPLTQEILNKHVNPIFVETGTYQCEAVEMAKKAGFSRIHTIEFDAGMAKAAASRYASDKSVTTYMGDSADRLTQIVPQLNQPTTFWLDAHPLVTPMPLFTPCFPLLRELLALKRFLPNITFTLLIDDMRTFSAEELSMLEFAIKQLWPNGVHSFYDDRLAHNDIYCCTVQKA